MLRQLRSAAKTKVAGIIIGALILAFAVWGVGDIFRGAVSTTIAEVGDTEVTGIQFSREVRARMRMIGQPQGLTLTIEDARQAGIDDEVLNGIIARTALDEVAADFGLVASDATVRDVIVQSFSDEGGNFNQQQFLTVLRDNGFTQEEYIELARRDVPRAQLTGSLGSAFVAPPGLVNLLHDFFFETRVAHYIVLTPEDGGELPVPTEEQLAQFHEGHPELFNAPEYREIEYVAITPEAVMGEIEISEEELVQEFENPQAPLGTPEQREIQQITYPDQEAAAAAKARFEDGVDFVTLAQERQLSAEDISRGSVTAEQMGEALAGPAFATEAGAVTEPLQGQFGWTLVHVVSVTPGTSLSFEEAREQLRQNILSRRAVDLIAERSNALQDASAGGASLPEAATAVGLETQTVEAVDPRGLAPDGVPAAGPQDPIFLQQAFNTLEGEESFAFEGGDRNIYVVRVNSITPVALRPLETVRAEVEAAWADEARANALMLRADELAEQARSAGLDAVAESLSRMVTVSMPLGRGYYGDVIGPEALERIFFAPAGTVVTAPAGNGMDYIVASVEEIFHTVPDIASAEYADLRQNLTGELAQDIAQGLAEAAREEVGVTIYEANIDAALNQGIFY